MKIGAGMYAQTTMQNTCIYKAFSYVLPFKIVVFGFNSKAKISTISLNTRDGIYATFQLNNQMIKSTCLQWNPRPLDVVKQLL